MSSQKSFRTFLLRQSPRTIAALLTWLVIAGFCLVAEAQDLHGVTGEWIKTSSPSRPDQPGIGAYIIFDPRDTTRLILSWAPPVRFGSPNGQYGANLVWRSETASCWYEFNRTGTKLTLRLLKSDPPGVCLEDSIFEARPVPVNPGTDRSLGSPQIGNSQIQPPSPFPCQKESVLNWLVKHGAYGDDNELDTSVYEDPVKWVVNGKAERKHRSELVSDEDEYRQIYPVRKFTVVRSSATGSDGRCTLSMQVDSYKQRQNGKVERGSFNISFGIRVGAQGPRIVEQQIDVLQKW